MANPKYQEVKEEVITARCNGYVKKILSLLSQSEHLSMSDVIAKSIVEYHQRHFPNQAFCKKEQELFGRYSSGKGDLSVNRKRYLKEIFSEKHGDN